MKYIPLILIAALITAVSSCGQGKIELPSDTVDTAETADIETTFDETTAEVTTVTETTESSDVPETSELPANNETAEPDSTVIETTESSDIPETSELPADNETAEPDSTDIEAIIDENLDILASDKYNASSDKEIVEAHPEEFEKLISLGDAALPYLKEIGKEYKSVGGDTSGNLRCFIAMAAAYAIDPDSYDRVYPSPDGRYAIKATVSSFERLVDPFAGTTYDLTLVKTETGEALATSDEACCFSRIQWSPDSKYASFANSYRHWFTYLYIFDTENSSFYALPKERELEDFLGAKLESTDENDNSFVNLHCYIEEWKSDSVRVQIALESPVGGEFVGWYLYDLAAREISSAEFTSVNNTDKYPLNEGTFVYVYPKADVEIRANYPVIGKAAPCGDLSDEQIHEYVKAFYKERVESDSVDANDSLKSVMQYEITRCDEDILSIHFSVSMSGGGSPDHVSDEGLTFDPKTGEQVTLRSLYDDETISRLIDEYFDSLDTASCPTLFSQYTVDEIREDFHTRFDSDNDYRDRSFYVGDSRLYLLAGFYDYAMDMESPFAGKRAFIAEIDM